MLPDDLTESPLLASNYVIITEILEASIGKESKEKKHSSSTEASSHDSHSRPLTEAQTTDSFAISPSLATFSSSNSASKTSFHSLASVFAPSISSAINSQSFFSPCRIFSAACHHTDPSSYFSNLQGKILTQRFLPASSKFTTRKKVLCFSSAYAPRTFRNSPQAFLATFPSLHPRAGDSSTPSSLHSKTLSPISPVSSLTPSSLVHSSTFSLFSPS